MPSTKVAGGSAILTTEGWISADAAPTGTIAMGIGRDGRLEARAVLVSAAGELEQLAYLGTKSTFGEFSPRTRVLTSLGSRGMDDLISTGDVTGVRFETMAELPVDVGWSFAHNEIWNVLSTAAAIKKDGQIAVRCCQQNVPESPPFRVRQVGTQKYLLLNEGELQRAMASNPINTVRILVDLWVRNVRTKTAEIERPFHRVVMHYICALQHSRIQYSLKYDSLQHTSLIVVQDSMEALPPVTKGACAFFGPSGGPEFSVAWDGAGWSPIASGFLLEPS